MLNHGQKIIYHIETIIYVKYQSPFIVFKNYNIRMKTVRQLNIRDKQVHFFTDMTNINDFAPGLLHVNKAVIDYDLIACDIKYVKNLNRIDNLCIVFNDLDVVFRRSGKDKYLIFSSTKKNSLLLENYTAIFDEIAEQIESISDDKVNYYRDITRIKFKTYDDLVFNEIINIPVCVIVVSGVVKEEDKYYPQILLHDCFYEHDVLPDA